LKETDNAILGILIQTNLLTTKIRRSYMLFRFTTKTILALALILVSTAAVWAAEMGTPDEAKALNEKAVAAAKKDKDKAFAAFAEEGGPYKVKDLYVFCMDMEGVMLVHPKASLVGKNLLDFNKHGDLLFQDMVTVAKEKGSGWVDYKWPYPGTEEIKEKTTYIETVDGDTFCGVGAYK